jgi:two-component system LytT family response regulator
VSNLRIVLAEDEFIARKRLVRLLEAMPDVEVLAAFDNAEALLQGLATMECDVLLLDIHMPGLSGLDAAARLRDPAPRIIFVTAHREHAVAAFDAGAADYVLKPVDPTRLRQALDRASGALARGGQTSSIDPLAIDTANGVVVIDPKDISHVDFDGTLVTIHHGGQQTVTAQSLSTLLERLPRGFERVHRRHILALAHLDRLRIQPAGTAVATMKTGQEVPLSRAATRRLRRRLGV